MKAILKFKRADITEHEKDIEPNESDVCEIEAINHFVAEHGGYYGRPHGFRMAREGSRYFGLCYGCSVYLPQQKNDNLRDIVLKHFDIDIAEFDGFAKWLTSGSNFTGIGYNKEHVYVLLDGARHGLKQPFRDIEEKAEWTYLETWLPEDAHPYETRDQYASRSLKNALAARTAYQYEELEYEKLLISLGADEENLMSEDQIIFTYLKCMGIVKANIDEYMPETLKALQDDLMSHLEMRGFKEKYENILDKSWAQIRATYFPNEPQYVFYEKFKLALNFKTGYEPNNPFKVLKGVK